MSDQKMSKRLFGTNGIRGIVGTEMTPDLALRIGAALATMRRGSIAVGRDTRTSGEGLAHAVKAGILMCGCDVIDLGILPIPALQYIQRGRCDAGAMVTASHNPPQYNGIKIIDSDGTEMGDAEIIRLESILFDGGFSAASWDQVGTERSGAHLLDRYIEGVVSRFPAGIGDGMNVVVDPGSGPAALTTPRILSQLGCRVYTVNAQLDGRFPGRLPEPSPEGLKALSEMVVSTGSAFGVAHDGDADRAVFIDDQGRYVEENHEFALIADHICSQEKGIIVTPVSTSRLIEDVAEKYGCSVDYTPVGSIYVARRMKELIAAGERVVFGGEGNGGLIYPGFQFCRDGGMTAAMMVALLAARRADLSSMLDDLPAYCLIKEKISAENRHELIERCADLFSSEVTDLSDGVRISRGRTWALIRASGTEPLVRLMVESDDIKAAEAFCREIMDAIAPLLG